MSTAMPSRRNVVRTAAWTVPVVAASAAAPAYAASCGTATHAWRLDWGNDNTTDAFTTSYPTPTVAGGVQTGVATITGPAGTTPVKVTFASQMLGGMVRDSDNLRISDTLSPVANNVGGLGQGAGLNISHQAPIPVGVANRQDISISFDRAVTGLQFTITDVDRQDGDWSDRVTLTGARTSSDAPDIRGDGTSGAPWRPRGSADNADNSSGAGNVAVTYGGTIPANTAIVLSFWNDAGNRNQRVFLSDFTFTAGGC